MRTLLLVAATFTVYGQTSVLKHTFNTGTEGWLVLGADCSVKVGKDAKTGGGALQFSYSLDGKGIGTAVYPAGAGRLSAMRRLRFWVKADHDAALGVLLAEKKPGGGDYTALVWAPKNVWQRVDLALSDFIANDGPNDPVDADGRLDADQVEGLGIFDFSNFFNQLPSDSPIMVIKKTGAHTLLIDDFEILDGDGPASRSGKPGSILVDGFDRGFSTWITMGSVGLTLVGSENPIGAPALAAEIKGVDGKLNLLLRRVNARELAGAKRISFEIAAEREGTFSISIETAKPGAPSGQSPRYNFLLYPPGERKVFRVNVSLADFEHDPNSPEDAAGHLEASRMKTITISDLTALAGGVAADNKIWIGRIEMLK